MGLTEIALIKFGNFKDYDRKFKKLSHLLLRRKEILLLQKVVFFPYEIDRNALIKFGNFKYFDPKFEKIYHLLLRRKAILL